MDTGQPSMMWPSCCTPLVVMKICQQDKIQETSKFCRRLLRDQELFFFQIYLLRREEVNQVLSLPGNRTRARANDESARIQRNQETHFYEASWTELLSNPNKRPKNFVHECVFERSLLVTLKIARECLQCLKMFCSYKQQFAFRRNSPLKFNENSHDSLGPGQKFEDDFAWHESVLRAHLLKEPVSQGISSTLSQNVAEATNFESRQKKVWSRKHSARILTPTEQFANTKNSTHLPKTLKQTKIILWNSHTVERMIFQKIAAVDTC